MPSRMYSLDVNKVFAKDIYIRTSALQVTEVQTLKKLMDQAVYSFTKSEFDFAMSALKKENKGAWKWLSDIPTKHWARHAFDTNCKTDLVVNNVSEVFNNYY